MMKTYIQFTIIAFAVLGLAVGCAPTTGKESAWHAYGNVDVPEGFPIPAVKIELSEDANSGWNMHLVTENIEFAPERAGTEHYPGEGHAHLYIDDKMLARVYGKWFHIPQLPAGRHQITVTLNSNDHNAYSVNGRIISDTAIVEVERTPESDDKDSSGGYGSSGY